MVYSNPVQRLASFIKVMNTPKVKKAQLAKDKVQVYKLFRNLMQKNWAADRSMKVKKEMINLKVNF